jgi:ATP-binding cassette, subfamily C (CFTR/MRP), member 1
MSAFKRLDEFFDKYAVSEGSTYKLNAEETSLTNAGQDAFCRVVIRDADFGWHKEAVAENRLLTGISLKISSGELVACVGPVGSGKSSLLLALLNELHRYEGTCASRGRIAYCGQEPWILNAALKRNVTLFGRDPHVVNEQRYYSTLRACCLLPDIALMPGGDDTEIGEKGVTLSGGQKARLALARAVYSDSDIYLLDDPLSSVDATVSKQLKTRLFVAEGMLRDKAVVIVTHQLHLLPVADRVLVMSKGSILHDGSFQSLLSNGVDFGRLLEAPIRSDDTSEDAREERCIEERVKLEQQGPKEKAGPTTVAEDRRIGKVPSSIYVAYIKAGGGIFALFAIAATFTLSQCARSGSDVWLRLWSAHRISGRRDSFYALIFLMFCTLAIAFAGLRAYLYADRSTSASQRW